MLPWKRVNTDSKKILNAPVCLGRARVDGLFGSIAAPAGDRTRTIC